MSWLRAFAFNLLLFFWTAAMGTLGLPMLLAPRRRVMDFGRLWAKGVLFLLKTVVGLGFEIRGRERLPQGSFILAMKHQSAWDAVILPVVLGDPAAVVKRELILLPFYGWYMARAGAIAIDRKSGAGALRAMVRAARPAAAAGRPIVIFPQGTRTAPGEERAYQPGAAALYQALSLPLVPAAVNSGLYWGRRSFLKKKGRITLEFLEPIPPGLPRRRVMEELEQAIESASNALFEKALGPPDPGKASARRGKGLEACGGPSLKSP